MEAVVRKYMDNVSNSRDSAMIRGEILLGLPRFVTLKKIEAHRVKLQQLNREGMAVWIFLDSVTNQTRFWLNFAEHTFHQTESREAIHSQLRQWWSPSQAFNRIYLLAQTNAEAPCYDITDYIQRCVGGDLSIADRLKGRTIFRLHQTEIQANDLLSRDGVHEIAHRILKEYIHQFAGFIGRPVVGFCCEFPTFLSPLRSPPLAIPWSDAFGVVLGSEPLSHLPLICYETYDSATIRSRFWERLTQQFAKVCVGGLKEFCHQWNLQFAVNFPATAIALEVDVGGILNAADRPILSTDNLDKPKQFLIAKQITSALHSERLGQISICRSDSSLEHGAELSAGDSVLGFNSWMFAVNHNAKPRFHRGGVLTQNHLNRFLSIGVPKRSVLIVSPVHSLWTKPDPKTWNWIAKEWSWLCQTVWELGYDFDIASETVLAAAEIDKGARALRLNEESYPLILLPCCLSLQEGTVGVLTRFVKEVKVRGRLITMDPVPYLLNGRIGIDPYPLERLLYRWRTSTLRGTTDEKVASLERLLRKRIKPPIQVYVKPDNAPTHAIAVQYRQSENLDLFYLFNRGERPIETLIEIQWEATVEEWNTVNGEQLPQDHWHANGKTYTTLSFDVRQGRLIVVRKDASQ